MGADRSLRLNDSELALAVFADITRTGVLSFIGDAHCRLIDNINSFTT